MSFISKQRLIYLIDKELLKIKEVVNNRNAKIDSRYKEKRNINGSQTLEKFIHNKRNAN